MTIKEIANKLEYKSLSSFSKAYHRLFGISPSEKKLPFKTKRKPAEMRILMNKAAVLLKTTSITVNKIATEMGFDAPTFNLAYKKYQKETPTETRLRHRAKMVHEMITKEHKTISETARIFGYKNINHLSLIYKKYYGMTPVQAIKGLNRAPKNVRKNQTKQFPNQKERE